MYKSVDNHTIVASFFKDNSPQTMTLFLDDEPPYKQEYYMSDFDFEANGYVELFNNITDMLHLFVDCIKNGSLHYIRFEHLESRILCAIYDEILKDDKKTVKLIETHSDMNLISPHGDSKPH